MSEIYIDKYHYSNTKVRPYLSETNYTCASGALHIAYRGLGLKYPEIQIIRDLKKGFYKSLSWLEMTDHAESLGFSVDFIKDEGFDLLLAPLYDVPYVMIVGWIAQDDPEVKMYHCSPVRFVSSKNIGLTNIGVQGFEKFSKEEFLPKWNDYNHNHPFMTIRNSQVNVSKT
jgi:hypothetical protein